MGRSKDIKLRPQTYVEDPTCKFQVIVPDVKTALVARAVVAVYNPQGEYEFMIAKAAAEEAGEDDSKINGDLIIRNSTGRGIEKVIREFVVYRVPDGSTESEKGRFRIYMDHGFNDPEMIALLKASVPEEVARMRQEEVI